MPHDIFISYSSKRKSVADEVCRYLEGNGLKCWMAPRNLIPGINFGNQIDDAIRNSKIVVLIFSQPASKSKWVSGEINVAFEEGKYIIPFCIDDTEMVGEYRIMLKQMHRIDAYPDYSHFLPNLLQSIQAIAEMDDKIKAHDEKLNKASEEIKENVKKAEKTQLAVDNKAKAWDFVSQARNEKDLNKKIELLTRAIEIDSDNDTAYINRGYAYRKMGNYDKAIEDYNKAIELNPQNDTAYNNRGYTYRKMGNYDKAIEDYTKAIELNPQNDTAYNNRGFAYNNLGNFDKAIEDFNSAIKKDSKKPYPYCHRGTSYRKKGKLDKAIEDCSKAIDLKPDYGGAYYNRGLAYQEKAKQERDENKKAEYEQLAKADLQKAKELKEKQED